MKVRMKRNREGLAGRKQDREREQERASERERNRYWRIILRQTYWKRKVLLDLKKPCLQRERERDIYGSSSCDGHIGSAGLCWT